ncbi:MAG: GTP-binding protein [Kiritimatiellae bacterium]|nr:GTP-binding protein [Kiritimatiellia bacterium]
MAGLNETPKGDRVHIAFFGLRNAGKSTLVNKLTGQDVAIVSDVAGTTTDPVSKAMEILPLGPCLVTDTAGLDDEGPLGEMRVKKSLEVLATTDIAVWVEDAPPDNPLVGPAGGSGVPPLSEGAPNSVGGSGVPPLQGGGLLSQGQEPFAFRSGETPLPPGGGAQLAAAVGASGAGVANGFAYARFLAACRARDIAVLHYRRGDDVEAFRRELAAVHLADAPHPLVGDLVTAGDLVVCVCPIDESAPKGRLILPQQQVVRELLDAGASALVCQPPQLASILGRAVAQRPPEPPLPVKFVITDSQAFKAVAAVVPSEIPLTSFSIVFARAKGDLAAYCAGVAALDALKDGDRVLISEGCTHHRQCNDIGTVKLPKWLAAKTGKKLNFEWTSGNSFPEDLSPYALVVHCGGCMLTRRAMQARIARCRAVGVPITNYGVCIAACHGIVASPDTCMVVRGS